MIPRVVVSCVLPNYLVRGGRSSEVYDGLADGEVALHRPRQVEELGRDELEDLVHVDVVRRAREEEGRLHRSCVCSGLLGTHKSLLAINTHRLFSIAMGLHNTTLCSCSAVVHVQSNNSSLDARLNF